MESKTHKPHDLVLSAQGVTKAFDGFKAINDLNFYLGEGELRTVIGPNGAGKSTFMDLITGRTRPDEGTIIFHKGEGDKENVDLTRMKEYQVNRLGIARKFQAPSIYANHSVFDNLLLSLDRSRSLVKALFYKPAPADLEKIGEVLETIRLQDRQHETAGSLSHGQKQWLEIGMLLAQNPRILLVDEPAAGMSDEETVRTGELLLSLEGKHSVVVVEHDMEFVRQIARRVTVLHQGHVLKEGNFDFVASDPEVIEVYLGRQKHEKVA
ncbi:MAG: urea ABC transporter ATP-binding protein UrtD [Akkermansiaceae bacterium]|nr:urea ABC transporter ATP-binding protein UrtD [Akkermansiaceae bacterium]